MDSNVGACKERNYREYIFVINFIMNNFTKGNLRSIDATTYDAEIGLDKLFAKDCFNDLSDNGFNNDKLPLLKQ